MNGVTTFSAAIFVQSSNFMLSYLCPTIVFDSHDRNVACGTTVNVGDFGEAHTSEQRY